VTASIIDGIAIAREVRAQWQARTAALKTRGITPGLAVILVGEDPASQVYVRNKIKACAENGLRSALYHLPAEVEEEEVLERIRTLNSDPTIHGILVQLPLPPHVRSAAVLETISVAKDVDGLHAQNIGSLLLGRPGLYPCTPAGCMILLDRIGAAVEGREAVVVGRSDIVGKPVAMMLLARRATVTICTSKTRDLASHTRRADILVVATGHPRLITADMVKPGAVVIDVGTNRLPNGKLAGDVDFDAVKEVAGWITPVPGGVGPMTITMLLANTVLAAEHLSAAPIRS